MARQLADGVPTFRTKSEFAADEIRRMILSGEAPPGSKLVVGDVASAIGISDTPVREAIKQLVSDEWLVEQPHIGAVVPVTTIEGLRELFGIRAAMSSLAIDLAGASFLAERLDEIDEVLEASQRAADAEDPREYASLNKAFHRLLSQTPVTPAVYRTLANLYARTERHRSGFDLVPSRLPESQAEHAAIRDAIARHDTEEASRLAHEHEMAGLRATIQAVEAMENDGGEDVRINRGDRV